MLKRSEVDHRRVAEIEAMIAEFSHACGVLDRAIEQEERLAGISDPTHFAYPMYAKTAAARRDNLKRSMFYLEGQLRANPMNAGENQRRVEPAPARGTQRQPASSL